MKIIQLVAENVKRLSAVTITPDGSMVQITGRNGQGKTSVLDSIAYALGGKELICDKPVRRGHDKAKIVCTLDDLIVTRTFTAVGGSTLTVTNAEGTKLASPQAVLDKLVGKLSFDPLAFSRMDPKKQAETLKALVGLDFSQIDASRADLFAKRTDLNRNLKSIESQIAVAPHHADAPAEEVSISELMADLTVAEQMNEAHRSGMAGLEKMRREEERLVSAIAAARKTLNDLIEQHEKIEAELLSEEAEAARSETVDIAPIKSAIASADATNRKVRENFARKELVSKRTGAEKAAENLTGSIDEIDETKNVMLAEAKFPVAGLSFDESGVVFNGIPFAQASAAEQLRVSVAMGLAMNPQLKVLLIRDGSLLDAESLQLIAEMAEKNDAQIWLEKVSDGEQVGVVIEDGAVAGVESQQPETQRA